METRLSRKVILLLVSCRRGTAEAAGFGFIGLSMAHKISVLLPIFAIIIAAIYLVRARRRSKKSFDVV
jgi:uncharacterized membrane protein (DUF485 family)